LTFFESVFAGVFTAVFAGVFSFGFVVVFGAFLVGRLYLTTFLSFLVVVFAAAPCVAQNLLKVVVVNIGENGFFLSTYL